MDEIRNYLGEIINNVNRELEDLSYGTGEYDENGCPKINWDYYITEIYDHGFKKKNGKPCCVDYILPYGSKILRYGTEYGYYTAPAGTPYELLSLPYKKETLAYNEYEVMADGILVKCIVKKGKVAKSRNSKGGAIQFYHKEQIHHLVTTGKLKKIEWWRK